MKEGWRDQILANFAPNISRLTLVADPDALLLEERILEGIRERGFELIPFEDSIEFRYAYESNFRSLWDAGQQTELVVLLRSASSDLDSLPYDLLHAGRKLSFSLGEVFPNLSYPVVDALDRGFFDSLFEAQGQYGVEVCGENATKDFILRHVFRIAPEMVAEPVDLLRVLLRCHYRGMEIPGLISERLVQLLKQKEAFQEWPLELIVPDREAFFAFLQERWPVFLDRLAEQKDEAISERERSSYGLSYPGPVLLPFDHHDVRVFIDNLFLEGMLTPVARSDTHALSGSWAALGIETKSGADSLHRLKKILQIVRDNIPDQAARYDEWTNFARSWSELLLLAFDPDQSIPEPEKSEIDSIRQTVDTNFTFWLNKRYAGLINLPPAPPVMLHHVPKFIARYVQDHPGCRAALLVIDGMSFSQWSIVREELGRQLENLKFRESAVFSWVPTLTAVARQALFSGKAPFYFPASIHTTNKESTLWEQFWIDCGLAPNAVYYKRGFSDATLDECSDRLDDPGIRVAGLVANQVDDIMHGMALGGSGMQNQVRQWARQPFLAALVEMLLKRGYRIYLTSDHGNTEATGCGRPTEGVLANVRGERTRVYADDLQRKKAQNLYQGSFAWEPVGLPGGYLPLIAPHGKAFVQEGKTIVTHGGISLEELIVPFVQIERKSE